MNSHPFRQPLVFIATRAGFLHLVTDPDDCTVCQQRGEVQIWNPNIRDGLTHELTPPAHRIWKLPCPVCRPDAFDRWEAPQ
ncbi:hypothetical protein [Micromonospora sp. WMMD975]|uniref:hypothetical protein n=1 Tax=Micromonospora sp. WMMD975 TaxID=3016087 RepID=UPI00249AE163|nr:hypothetical protein [Micromonospora sp. WMMD975]WFE32925.1 hypothetical protein O7613_25795 [Micromonospora sp. WMMD975]